MCVCLQLSPLLLLTTIKRSISIVNIKNNDIFFDDIGVYLYQIIVFSLCIISSHLTDGSCLGLLARLQLVASLLDKARMEQDVDFRNNHTSYLSRIPRIYQCKFFLAGVSFYRFNAKNWQFTVYFAVITQKIGNFLCILS